MIGSALLRGTSGTRQVMVLSAALLLPGIPPADGPMLVLPVRPASAGSTIAWATEAGARLRGPGPYEGSYFVNGERARLIGPALEAGALLIAARGGGCDPERNTRWNK
ncbi:hypothetical protein [Sphingomonas sp. IC-11]|uniref:hypothetical protein n=1 Tax=Sphingomonas sp. IC-11 TaxID=2898528 RepID=UPI001E656606|nr:hypothetical protein [Sphingomonas sp. IC-11]